MKVVFASFCVSCGQSKCTHGSMNDPDDGRVIGLDCALGLDPGLAELADLPLGWKAWRDSSDHEWDR